MTSVTSATPNQERNAPTLRAFIAVEIGEEVAARAAQVVERLRGAGDMKWVDARNLHLTVKFLGATRPEDLPWLSEALRGLAGRTAPFEVELAGVGAFPNIQRPQVVWLGAGTGREALERLAEATEAVCEALGWAREEKPYRAHLTLGRARNPRREGKGHPQRAGGDVSLPNLIRALEAERDVAAGTTSIDRLLLKQSQLQRQGPVYTLLDSFSLGGSK
jgi:2'-5' RNA ligase